jgi:hypothetical protein
MGCRAEKTITPSRNGISFRQSVAWEEIWDKETVHGLFRMMAVSIR